MGPGSSNPLDALVPTTVIFACQQNVKDLSQRRLTARTAGKQVFRPRGSNLRSAMLQPGERATRALLDWVQPRWKPLSSSQGSGAFRRRGTMEAGARGDAERNDFLCCS